MIRNGDCGTSHSWRRYWIVRHAMLPIKLAGVWRFLCGNRGIALANRLVERDATARTVRHILGIYIRKWALFPAI